MGENSSVILDNKQASFEALYEGDVSEAIRLPFVSQLTCVSFKLEEPAPDAA